MFVSDRSHHLPSVPRRIWLPPFFRSMARNGSYEVGMCFMFCVLCFVITVLCLSLRQLGMIDDDGYVHVMSRSDDIINVTAHRFSTGTQFL